MMKKRKNQGKQSEFYTLNFVISGQCGDITVLLTSLLFYFFVLTLSTYGMLLLLCHLKLLYKMTTIFNDIIE